MKRIILLFALVLNLSTNAQCWKTASYGSGIKTDGTLWMWGHGGRIGDGTLNASNVPIQIGTDTWKTVESGGYSTIAIKTDGSLWAWGGNSAGHLGDGTFIDRTFPVQIGTDTDWQSISSDISGHTLALKTDGSLWAWGENTNGELGDGTRTIKNYPLRIGTENNWKIAMAGKRHSIAIKTDGSLWAWGQNYNGSLGLGSSAYNNVLTPTRVGTSNDWKTISRHFMYCSFALKTNGTLWAWGHNITYNLGDGTLTSRNVPTQIGTDTDWVSIGASCGVKSNGSVWGWGQNYEGELGNGTTGHVSVPTQIGTDTDWVAVYNKSIKLKANGTLWTSGYNVDGSLGTGTTTNSLVPVPVLTTNCSTTPIVAINDTSTSLNGIASTAVANVLANDTYNSLPATTSNVNLSFISATHAGITLDTSTGAVNVNTTVPVGNYTLIYQICDPGNSLNCSTATVTITVNPQTIDAVNDNFSTPINFLVGGMTPSIFTNDLLNTVAVNSSEISATLVNNGGISGASISSTGTIFVPPGTAIGNYTLTYTICSVATPALCDTATVTLSVSDQIITTPEIAFAIRANNTVHKAALQSNGKIIIAGAFTKYNNISSVGLARLNTDVTLDTSFLDTGSVPAGRPPYDFAVLPNDKIIAVGYFTGFNGGSNGNGIVKLNSDGTVDTSFNVGGSGIGANDIVRALAVQSDGKILLGGGFIHSYNGVTTQNMIRLNADGSLDTTFRFPYTYQKSTYSSINKITVLPNGKILVAGHQGTTWIERNFFGERPRIYPGQPHLFLLNHDGSLDTSFEPSYIDAASYYDTCSSCNFPIQNLLVQPDGKIVVVGAFKNYNSQEKSFIVRLKDNGSIDDTFTVATTSSRAIKDVIMEPSGKLIIGGEFDKYSGNSIAKRLARLNTNGTLDTTFSPASGPTGTYPRSSVHDLQRQADGKIIVCGNFTHYNAISATNITRIITEVAGGQARLGQNNQIDNNALDITTTGTIKIYPNPSQGIFTFDLSGLDQKFDKIEIYNTLGQLIFQNMLSQKVIEIDLSRVESGTYFAKISNESNSIQKVLIKK